MRGLGALLVLGGVLFMYLTFTNSTGAVITALTKGTTSATKP